MTWDPWAIKPDSERSVWESARWPLSDHSSSGWCTPRSSKRSNIGRVLAIGATRLSNARFGQGFTTYYEDGHLHAVAIDACVGPQVRFEGAQLAGRPPSEVADWYGDNFERLEADYVVNQHGDPSSDSLGFVIQICRVLVGHVDVVNAIVRLNVLVQSWAGEKVIS
jgi:hypothetical protein